MRRLRYRADAHLLIRNGQRRGRRALRAGTAIERKILRLARNLRLQVADGMRHLRLLARPADALRINLGESQIELMFLVLEPVDRDFKLSALLRDGKPVVACVVAAELIDDIERKHKQQQRRDEGEHAAQRRIGAYDDGVAAGFSHGKERTVSRWTPPSARWRHARGA